jgi:DNA-binding MarR family transcriptional regulator
MAFSTVHCLSWFANLRRSGEDKKMALCEKPNPMPPAPRVPRENQKAPTPTPQQRRLLRLLQQGDLIWEIAEDPRHRTVYDEKRGCSRRLTTAAATALEQQGWIQRRPNPQADRLDSWELTLLGRTLIATPSSRPVQKVNSALPRRSARQEAKDQSQLLHH